MVSQLRKTCAVLLAGVGVTAAVSVPRALAPSLSGVSGLSNSCQTALLGISQNQEASSCLNLPGLVAIVTLQPNSSAVPPINTWLEQLCAAQPCSNATLISVATNITSGCQSDLSNQGVSQSAIQTIIQDLPQLYPVIRDVGCLKTTSNNTLCLSSTLLDFQQFTGQPLTINDATGTFSQVLGQGNGTQLPSSLICTGCIQAAYDVLQANAGMFSSNPALQSSITSQCGSNFLTSPQPTDVVEGTGSAAPTGTLPGISGTKANAAGILAAPLLGISASSMLAIVAGFFVLSA